ncbi:MAG: ATP-binding cassette, subfamily bacterial [Actinomycetota bacterium]|jgi:ATP-binding cassette subfamily B protein|nr:ATP-binding cassette, subfamily bacterial [Actinomycetota bacterium]
MAGATGSWWGRLPHALTRSVGFVRAAAPREFNAIVALQAAGAVCLVGQLVLARTVLQEVLDTDRAGDHGRLIAALLALGAVTAVSALCAGLAGERRRLMVELVRRHASRRILDVTAAVDLASFESVPFNDGLARAKQHAESRPQEIVAGIIQVGQSALTSAGLAVTLATIAPELLPVLVLGVAPTILFLRRNSRDLHALERRLTPSDRERWYLEDVLSTTAGAKESRTYRLPAILRPRHEALFESRIAAHRDLARRRSVRIGFVSVLGALVVVGGLGLLAALVVDGRMTPADAATAAVVVQQLTVRTRMASAGAGLLYENSLFLDDVDEFLALLPPVRPVGSATTDARPPSPPPELHALTVSHLDFTYPGTDRPVLRDISLRIAAGEIVALVGENGSGKTTLTKLLCGLYVPTAGTIRWDDQPAADVDPEDWRRRFGVVFQDFMRYELPARLNVAIGRHQAQHDLDAVRAAARLADADGFLGGLPDGYETILSRAYAGGADLSLGQWQRLALARAFFSDAPVLVLDEPTAALDPRVEQELLVRVRALAGAKTVLLISHRLSSVRFADRIYVLHQGVLVEEGHHDELVARAGHYAELFDLQASAYRVSARPSGYGRAVEGFDEGAG